MAIWNNIRKAFNFAIKGPQGIKVQKNIVPFGPAISKAPAVATGAGKVLKSFYQGVKTFTTKKNN